MNPILFTILAGLLFMNASFAGNKSVHFDKLLVEYAANPNNIDETHPRFSWIVSSEKRNQVQSAYQVLVASSAKRLAKGDADIWSSGKVNSSETIQVEYPASNLKSCSRYFWKVKIWDGNGTWYVSNVATFETAFLSQNEWKAAWIGKDAANEILPAQGFYKDKKEQFAGKDTIRHDGKSLLLRRESEITKQIQSARAYVTGVGFYEFFVNGQRVGDHVLAPAKTPYHKYILYDSYDITSLLKKGKNAFGIHLGNGWYNPYKKWWNDYRMQWFGHKKAIAQILLVFSDGTSQIIATGPDWKWSHGPITYNCVYDGETYDARLEQEGWNKPDFDDSNWQKATVFEKPNVRLVSHSMPPVKVNEVFKPKEVASNSLQTRVFDMGQNFAGWVKLAAHGAKGTVIRIRFAEDLKADGTIDVTSNEHAKATAEYILKGAGTETYETHFSYFGFKYAEVSAIGGPLNLDAIEGRAVYSANAETGAFNCDNTLINKIHRATIWSQKSNMISYPMDCPQRDERLGWFGDAQVTAEEAMFNFDMALFYENWFEGIKDNQDEKTGDIPIISPRPYIKDDGIEWSSTYLTMLWSYYCYYDDQRILAHHYPAMKRYMEFLGKLSNDLILPMGWIGDWGSMVKGWKEGQPESAPTAFYFWNAQIMSKVAGIIGKKDDQETYRLLGTRIREKYNQKYLNVETGNYNDGSQMANAFPLFLGLVPEGSKQKVLSNLVTDILQKNNAHLTTGVLGTKYMPEALAQMGRADVAWKIINQTTAPSWNDMMNKYTTVCEFWTLKQSKNHVMMGSIDAWFYKYLAGIQLDETNPAFKEIKIKPFLVDSLGGCKGEVMTLRGKVSWEWRRSPGLFTLKVQVPFNTTAMVYLPGKENDTLTEGGLLVNGLKEIENKGFKDGTFRLLVHSGNYTFNVAEKK
jgi:Alpha-L-rhamnosidase N-terminal domain./Bacterial alpha-L-rhamnosidase.